MPIDLASGLKNGHIKSNKHEDSVENESVRDETDSNQFLATDDLIRDLIEAVREEEVLYKPGHKHFRHLIKKHEAYVNVANLLRNQGYNDVTAERVKQKWNTIKSIYWRHKATCKNPCNPKESTFIFCQDLQFLSEFEFRFYRNRKSAGEKLAEKLHKVGNATAIVSNEITDESMNQLFELLGSIPSKMENNHVQNDTSENSNHSDIQSIHDFRLEPTSSEIILNNTLKRPMNSSFEDEVQAKKLQKLDLELEHQRFANQEAEQRARAARLEADLLEVRLQQEKAKLKQLN
ncbi:hypothetical protein M3Y97_00025000 [Aphelenchoides bicaudatus]|nr:hypothetical protein M3Y97_00025000 [Aphelenchoides bicaudatus]